jgi:C-terminal processing protease CtpA/Prc
VYAGESFQLSRNVRIWQGRARVLALCLFCVLVGTAGCGSGAPGTIGAALGQTRERRLFVRSLPPGQGAAQAGLELDDEILSIDGTGVGAMSQDDVRRAVRGPVGSTMVLKVRRTGPTGASEEREVKVVRTPLEGPPGTSTSTEAPR